MKSKLEQLEGLKIIELYNKLRPRNAQEAIDELYATNNVDGLWSIHLDDVDLGFELEDWMYSYALSLQPGYNESLKAKKERNINDVLDNLSCARNSLSWKEFHNYAEKLIKSLLCNEKK